MIDVDGLTDMEKLREKESDAVLLTVMLVAQVAVPALKE